VERAYPINDSNRLFCLFYFLFRIRTAISAEFASNKFWWIVRRLLKALASVTEKIGGATVLHTKFFMAGINSSVDGLIRCG
jgi:hypothetical protein